MKKNLVRIIRWFITYDKRFSALESRVNDIMVGVSVNKPYLSKKEAAAYLDVTTHFIDSLIRSKEIGYFQPRDNGYSIYISRAELDRYITKKRYKSRLEIEMQERNVGTR